MRKYSIFTVAAAVLCTCFVAGHLTIPVSVAQEKQPAEAQVRINGHELSPEIVRELEVLYGVRPVPGDYWYDAMSGLYGAMGQQAMGMMMPGHLFGEMPENASGGSTGVFMNGRNLTGTEVNYINILMGTQAMPGRYWLDALGNCGIEGLPIPLVNFYEVSQRPLVP